MEVKLMEIGSIDKKIMEIELMEIELRDAVHMSCNTYVEIKNKDSVKKIHNLWVNGIFEEPTTGEECNYFGLYYHAKKKSTKEEKYYLMGVKKGDSYAMINLGDNHGRKKEYIKMVKYYKRSANKGNPYGAVKLAEYYRDKDRKKGIKYYLMANDLGHKDALLSLGYYFKSLGEHDLMEKFHLMGIEKGCSGCARNLIDYYNDNPSKTSKDIILLTIYNIDGNRKSRKNVVTLLNKIFNEKERINIDILNFLLEYKHTLPAPIKIIKELLSKRINLLDSHFSYAPESNGYYATEEEFAKLGILNKKNSK